MDGIEVTIVEQSDRWCPSVNSVLTDMPSGAQLRTALSGLETVGLRYEYYKARLAPHQPIRQ